MFLHLPRSLSIDFCFTLYMCLIKKMIMTKIIYLLWNPHLKLLYMPWNLYRKILNVLLQNLTRMEHFEKIRLKLVQNKIIMIGLLFL